jgi:hypothetical protein
MRRHQLLTAVTVLCLGLATGCERSTPGTVAMTTEPGTSTSSRQSSTPSRPTSSAPTTKSPVPVVPAPPNAKTMTCREFTGLDEATRLAVVRAILADQNSVLGAGNEDVAQTLADTLCGFLPDSTVNEILLGEPLP